MRIRASDPIRADQHVREYYAVPLLCSRSRLTDAAALQRITSMAQAQLSKVAVTSILKPAGKRTGLPLQGTCSFEPANCGRDVVACAVSMRLCDQGAELRVAGLRRPRCRGCVRLRWLVVRKSLGTGFSTRFGTRRDSPLRDEQYGARSAAATAATRTGLKTHSSGCETNQPRKERLALEVLTVCG